MSAIGNQLDLRAILARANAATPGPWLGDPTGTVCAASDVVPDGQGGEILPPDGPMEIAECYRRELPDERAKNADFIASARTDVPELVAEVQVLQAIVRRVVSITQDTDGDSLDQDEEVPVGEVLRMLYEFPKQATVVDRALQGGVINESPMDVRNTDR